jgi:hypothetical protein
VLVVAGLRRLEVSSGQILKSVFSQLTLRGWPPWPMINSITMHLN